MTAPKSRKGVVQQYKQCSRDVRDYLEHLPDLADDFPLDVALSYMFARVEQAHLDSLYCGVVKLHEAQKDVASQTILSQHMTRESFAQFFKAIFGKDVPPRTADRLNEAYKVRNKVLHGKLASEADMRKAVGRLLEYAEEFNGFVESAAGFRPLGDLRGFKGRAESLPKSTTRWLLKGMGFRVS